jgi:hypothetical protein
MCMRSSIVVLVALAQLCHTWAPTTIATPPILPRRPHPLSRSLVAVCAAADEPRAPRTRIGGGDAIDVEAAIGAIVQQEIAAARSLADPHAQEAALATLLERVERRAVEELGARGAAADAAESVGEGVTEGVKEGVIARETVAAEGAAGGAAGGAAEGAGAMADGVGSEEAGGYRFGDVTRAVLESARGEVRRQLAAEWDGDDLALLLKLGIFLGASASAPVAGLAALPAAALLATYGTVLKAELGVRAVKEVGARLAERAAQGLADGVASYTGKEEYRFGDVTEATVRRATGNDEYRFGDWTKGAVRRMTGKEEYRFGDISKSLFRRLARGDESGRGADSERDTEGRGGDDDSLGGPASGR